MSRGFVTYLRVPTGRAGQPDLGARRAAVADFVADRKGKLLAECVEGGRGHGRSRPELARALALCRRHGATLAVPDLAGLARDVAFITGVLESGVDFVAVDIPQADRHALYVLGAIAAREREQASRRTAAALAAARARGARPGNPHAAAAAAMGRAALEARAAPARQAALPHAVALQRAGLSLRRIAAALNARSVATPRGGRWHAATVAALLRTAEAAPAERSCVEVS